MPPVDRDDHADNINGKSINTSGIFLNISANAGQITNEAFKAIFGLVLTILLAFIPISLGAVNDLSASKSEIQKLKDDLNSLKKQQAANQRALDTLKE